MNMKENEAIRTLEDGEPCKHLGCLSHISHPCEGCGRVGGKRVVLMSNPEPNNYLKELWDKSKDITPEYFAIPMAEEQVNCQTCTTPTKYPIGFWDGEKSHGQLFECHNFDCELKQNRIRVAEREEKQKLLVIEANRKHGLSMDSVKERRKKLGITLVKMAKGLGISPSTYSCYEQCRNVVPLEIIESIKKVLREQHRSRIEDRIKEIYP